jgi:hypothetical protein
MAASGRSRHSPCCCDGLKGPPEAITTLWERSVVQTCIVHLIRNTFRYAARQYWDEMSRDLRPVYTAPSEAAAKERFVAFTQLDYVATLWTRRKLEPNRDHALEVLADSWYHLLWDEGSSGSTRSPSGTSEPTQSKKSCWIRAFRRSGVHAGAVAARSGRTATAGSLKEAPG